MLLDDLIIEAPLMPAVEVAAGATNKISRRTCVACRETAPREEMLRFVLSEQSGAFGNKSRIEFDQTRRCPGRGVWTHSSTQCFEKALLTGQLVKGLRAPKSAQNDEVVNDLRESVEAYLEMYYG